MILKMLTIIISGEIDSEVDYNDNEDTLLFSG